MSDGLWLSDDPFNRPVKEHNYAKKIAQMKQDGTLPYREGWITQVAVGHDIWCDINKDGICNCDPEITWTMEKIPPK